MHNHFKHRSHRKRTKFLTALVYDSFTDGNGTSLAAHSPDRGMGWTVASGACTVQGNEAMTDAVAGEKFTYIETEHSDVIVQADVRCGSSFCPGILLRYTDANHYFMAQLHKGLQKLIIKEDDTGYNDRAFVACTINENDEFNLRFVAKGNDLELYLDGVLKLTYTSTNNIAATKHGIWANSPGAGPGELDNFVVLVWKPPNS